MTTKPSKLQTLNESLVVAKANLEAARARLQPQIAAEQAVVDGLRTAYQKASKARSKAYEAFCTATRNVEARLFPAETKKALVAAVTARVSPQFPDADFERLAKEYQNRQVAADPEVRAANATWQETERADDKATRAYNIASNPGGKLAKLQYELEKFVDVVERLEKEIDRLPRYRDAAKERRAEERREAIQAEQTQAARALMEGFTF